MTVYSKSNDESAAGPFESRVFAAAWLRQQHRDQRVLQ
jgi:hypothetical protein